MDIGESKAMDIGESKAMDIGAAGKDAPFSNARPSFFDVSARGIFRRNTYMAAEKVLPSDGKAIQRSESAPLPPQNRHQPTLATSSRTQDTLQHPKFGMTHVFLFCRIVIQEYDFCGC